MALHLLAAALEISNKAHAYAQSAQSHKNIDVYNIKVREREKERE